MQKRIQLISVADDETRIAVIEDGLLQDLLIEHQNREQTKGNIYMGKVVQIQTAVQAAFVDYGQRRHGFLPLAEVNPDIIGGSKDRRGRSRLEEGQMVLVQVTREEVDHKGAALTTNLMLAGRFLVMMPHSSKGGVSKKIEDPAERDRLKGFLAGINAEEHSVIIRTAGKGRDLAELKKDYTQIKRHWEEISAKYEAGGKPGLIAEELDFITRSMRDYYQEGIEEIWVDQPEAFQKVLAFLKENAPRRQKDLKLFVGERSLFASYNIEKQVEQLTTRQVKLKSGGSIVIDQTEALVAIDVNSGRSNQESSVENTALRTNLEAADEVARQLRLRNLGGIVVVDFIDMEKSAHRRQVEERMAQAMSRDRAQHKLGEISEFGILELSRQRMAQRISSVIESTCPVCKGKGMVPSHLASVNLVLRSIREIAAKGGVEVIEGELPLDLAIHLLNERRQVIVDLELEFGIRIRITGNPSLHVFEERLLRGHGPGKKAPETANHNGATASKEGAGKRGRNRRRGRGRDGEERDEAAPQDEAAFEARPPRAAQHDAEEEESTDEDDNIGNILAPGERREFGDSGPREDNDRRRGRRGRGRNRGRGRDRDEHAPRTGRDDGSAALDPDYPEEEEAEGEAFSAAANEAPQEPREGGRGRDRRRNRDRGRDRHEGDDREQGHRPPRPERAAREEDDDEEHEGPNFNYSDEEEGQSIHPGALFPEVRELSGEERAQNATSFWNRLKGKPNGQVPPVVDDRYMWYPQSADAEPAEAPAKGKRPRRGDAPQDAAMDAAPKSSRGRGHNHQEEQPMKDKKPVKPVKAEKPAAKPAAAKAAAKPAAKAAKPAAKAAAKPATKAAKPAAKAAAKPAAKAAKPAAAKAAAKPAKAAATKAAKPAAAKAAAKAAKPAAKAAAKPAAKASKK